MASVAEEIAALRGTRTASFKDLLTHPSFSRLWRAMLVSSLGDWVGFVAVASLVARLGGRTLAGLAVAGVMLARLLPSVLFGAFAGVLVDRFDRKKIIITAVTLFGLLSLCTVLLTSVDQLLVLRPLTGFGLGAALPLTFVMANEFAPARIRARMVAAMACGFAIGAASGGLLQAEMLPFFGWQGIFFIGGILPLILAAALFLYLPESVSFGRSWAGRSRALRSAGLSRPKSSRISASPKLRFRRNRAVFVPAGR